MARLKISRMTHWILKHNPQHKNMNISNITNLIENAEQSMNALLTDLARRNGSGVAIFISNISDRIRYSLDGGELTDTLTDAIRDVFPTEELRKAKLHERIKSLTDAAEILRGRIENE